LMSVNAVGCAALDGGPPSHDGSHEHPVSKVKDAASAAIAAILMSLQ
jgi:hypothetical protein